MPKLVGNTRKYDSDDVRVNVRDIPASDRAPAMFRLNVYVTSEHGSGRGTLWAFRDGDMWIVDDVGVEPEREGIGTVLYEQAVIEAAKRGGRLASTNRVSEASRGFWHKQLHAGRAERRGPLRHIEGDDPDETDLFVLKPGVSDLANNGPLQPNAHSMTKVMRSFNRHFDEAERVFPDLGTVELHEDEMAGSDNGAGSERQFGYCADEKPIRIAFAAKTEALPQKYIDGLMAHEFGHALDFRYGRKRLERLWGKLPDSVERRADAIAGHAFGRRIEYGQNDIQCIGCGGKQTRPKKLG